jgi:hypothetical protein
MQRAYLTASPALRCRRTALMELDDARSSSVLSLQTGGERHD